MTRCLVDVNVWLALLIPRHAQHAAAVEWFEVLHVGEAGLCRFVQLALVRLLADAAVMGEYALPAEQGWRVVAELLLDERVELVQEPVAIGSVLQEVLRLAGPGGGAVMEAYLAAFAVAAGRMVVALDDGVGRFGVEVAVVG